MNDTSATVRLRWEVRHVSVYEAVVPVDQLPDALIEVDEDQWSIAEGDVDSYVARDFLEALDIAGSAEEQSLTVEGYTVLDTEPIAPIMVAAPPVSAAEVGHRFDDYAEEADHG